MAAKTKFVDVAEDAARKADDHIMDLCAPAKMSPEQAIDFLESVVDRCKAAVEALKEENDIE